jgi:hypothetical protein
MAASVGNSVSPLIPILWSRGLHAVQTPLWVDRFPASSRKKYLLL